MTNTAKVQGCTLLTVSSIIMLVIALPLTWWTFNMVYTTSPNDLPGDGLATWGCVVGALTYILSIPVGICGLVLRKKPEKFKVCCILGVVTAVLITVCAVMQRAVFLFTLLPLTILDVLYLIAAYAPKRNRNERKM